MSENISLNIHMEVPVIIMHQMVFNFLQYSKQKFFNYVGRYFLYIKFNCQNVSSGLDPIFYPFYLYTTIVVLKLPLN